VIYLIKKVFARFIFPIPLCLEVLLVGLLLLWFTRKQKTGKTVVTLAGVLIFLFASPVFSDLLLTPLESRYPPLVTTPGDRGSVGLSKVKFIVVLGGGFSYDASHPDTIRLNEASTARLVEGVRVSKELNCCKLVLSGGPAPGGVSSSAQAMAQLAQELGIGRQDMILEAQSQDTEDEARLVEPIVKEQPFILVTEASHMPRAMALFRKQGTQPIADPMDFHASQGQAMTFDGIFPNAQVLYGSERAVYEYLGLVLEKARGKI
jgi:uncharacterized SAM-binding protein YcdF (DUF218 family)